MHLDFHPCLRASLTEIPHSTRLDGSCSSNHGYSKEDFHGDAVLHDFDPISIKDSHPGAVAERARQKLGSFPWLETSR